MWMTLRLLMGRWGVLASVNDTARNWLPGVPGRSRPRRGPRWFIYLLRDSFAASLRRLRPAMPRRELRNPRIFHQAPINTRYKNSRSIWLCNLLIAREKDSAAPRDHECLALGLRIRAERTRANTYAIVVWKRAHRLIPLLLLLCFFLNNRPATFFVAEKLANNFQIVAQLQLYLQPRTAATCVNCCSVHVHSVRLHSLQAIRAPTILRKSSLMSWKMYRNLLRHFLILSTCTLSIHPLHFVLQQK